MSTGTLTVYQNSDTVNGNGTMFTSEAAAGGFILFRAGGVDYTLPIASIVSNTQLKLAVPFRGVQTAGLTWDYIPQRVMSLVTAGMVVQNTEALRGLVLDKQNWQKVFSSAASVSVTLPDGTTYTGPSWGSLSTSLSDKLSKTSNLSDLANKAIARNNLEVFRTPGIWYPSNHPDVSLRFGFYGITNTDPYEMMTYVGKDCLRIKGIFRSDGATVLAGNTLISVKPIDIDLITRNIAVSTFTPVTASYSTGLNPSVASYLQATNTGTGAQLLIPFIGAPLGVNFIMFDLLIVFVST